MDGESKTSGSTQSKIDHENEVMRVKVLIASITNCLPDYASKCIITRNNSHPDSITGFLGYLKMIVDGHPL